MTEKGEEQGAASAPERERRAVSVLERLQANPLVLWVVVFVLALVAFYAMNHFVMAGQGLPLNLDLTPAQ